MYTSVGAEDHINHMRLFPFPHIIPTPMHYGSYPIRGYFLTEMAEAVPNAADISNVWETFEGARGELLYISGHGMTSRG